MWSRDGGDALVRAGATQPDLVIVAARLPILDSSAVIRTIEHHWEMCILVGAAPSRRGVGPRSARRGRPRHRSPPL